LESVGPQNSSEPKILLLKYTFTLSIIIYHATAVFGSCKWQFTAQVMSVKTNQLKLLSSICFYLGFASILGSIAIWFLTGGTGADSQAHAERFGIFVGLWAPTFLILSNRFDRYAERQG
jgi:hypothetical protein